jgi:GT2 family glycosyltransferase
MDVQSLPDIIGYCDLVSAASVVGWAYDPAQPEIPLVMRVMIDGNYVCSVECNLVRNDVTGVGHSAQRVGFYVAIPPDVDGTVDHVIEFHCRDEKPIALRDALGIHQNWTLPKTTRLPGWDGQSSWIIGNVDPIRENEVCGWAYDRETPSDPVTLDILIDGEFQCSVVCNIERPDVAAAGHPTSLVGFKTEVPARYFDDSWHNLEVRPMKGDLRRFGTSQGEGAVRQAFRFAAHVIVGQVDGLRDGAVRGWVFRHDRPTGIKSGGLQVIVTMQGHPITQIKACDFRADVAAAHNCDPTCGFSFFPPIQFVAGKVAELHFTVIPGNIALVGSPVSIDFPSAETAAAIRDLYDATNKIFAEIWLLRDRLRRLTPEQTYTVENYDAWARQYQKALIAAPNQLEGLLPSDGSSPPLVSIICPAYRPRLKDFDAAVQSVRSQTYVNWELIIVDDASGSAELTACIESFVGRDKRIRTLSLTTNSGISGATNAAIERAVGNYIVLFDHDDLLEARAVEFMLAAALRTGAQILYSDEDKIDDEGVFSEVNLKPDWNYRLLLSQNYVCHLLLVERAQLTKIGAFRSECDGAQDHDIIIRLAEVTPHDKIVHVPEVLYHWRKTPTSTAWSGKSKAYTVAAGIRAVQDHLDRKGLEGRVHSPKGITCYEIDWKISREPAITIIIPYREHVAMTRACLEALWENTNYANYKVILVDNWSTTDAALDFAEEMNERKDVTVIRVEEAFNYSRLNNIAVANSTDELLLFMNNDVVVINSDWLRSMVGEMLADPKVGIVGNKLLYPTGLVQHGGVILGVGGVADHAHKGLSLDDGGYVARAISSQDLSAVTAACMLCRREAFDVVGGFDERDLQVAFNDVDFCLMVGRAGYRVVWTSASVAEHRESLSRGSDLRLDQQSRFFHENETMMARWGKAIAEDRFYHRAFSRQSGIFSNLGVPSIELERHPAGERRRPGRPETVSPQLLPLLRGVSREDTFPTDDVKTG